MVNVPRVLQTKSDYESAYDIAFNDPLQRGKVINKFKGLIKSSYQYEFSRTLTETEEPDGPEPDYFVVAASEEVERHQLVRTTNKSAKIFRIGYTVAEVEQKINDLEAL